MDLGLKGRHALVAGSSSGIGKAIANLLLGEGVEVCLIARGEDRLRECAEELSTRHGREVHRVIADLSTADGARKAHAHADSSMGGIDILVNNTGGPKAGSFDTLDDEDWEDAFALNLMSNVRLTRLVLPSMKSGRWGRIVNITSTSVKQPIEGLMLSNAIRMAVVGFAKTLGDEVGEYGITINTIAPGFTSTNRLEQLSETRASKDGVTAIEVLERWKRDVPLGRIGRPEEVAAAVVFICSEPGSYINGVTLAVDGGRIRSAL